MPLASNEGVRLMKVFLIGGTTQKRGTSQFNGRLSVIRSTCHSLGKDLAARGHGLILCSPFRDSADFNAAIGAADGQDPALEFHYPDIATVKDELKKLLTDIPNARVTRMPCIPLGDKAMQYSWLFSQLNALDASSGVIAIGGKPTSDAQFLFRLAAAKNKSILPFTFLGGAAADYFDNNKWDLRDVLGK
jgi:hypothetical protein